MKTSDRRIRLKRAGLALLVLLALGLGYKGWRIARHALGLRQSAQALQAMIDIDPAELDLESAAQTIEQAQDQASALRRELRPFVPLTDRLGWLPGVGPTVAAAGPLTDYAAELTAAGHALFSGVRPLLDLDEGSGPLSARLLQTLEAAEPQFAAAQASFAAAFQARERFNLEALPGPVKEPLARVDSVLPMVEAGLPLLERLPKLLGGDAPQSYLILAQNDDELRATGGFISGVGTVSVERGELTHFSIGDSYAVDDFSKVYPKPPEALQRYMLAEQWVVRDANWSPDFPTTARQLQDLYLFSTGTQVDGVIAFDQAALEAILEVTGPLSVEGVEEKVNSFNVRAYIQAARDPPAGEGPTEEWWLHRKDFMQDLGAGLMDRLLHVRGAGEAMPLGRTLLRIVREKHLLLQFNDPQVSEAMSALGLDGGLHPAPGDFVMVVDTNVGFNKVDHLIERGIEYTVDLRDPSAPRASLRLAYRNSVQRKIPCQQIASYGEGGYEDLQQRCYWDYLRVYAPSGVRFDAGSLPPVPAVSMMSDEPQDGRWEHGLAEHGLTQFDGLLLLPTGESVELELSYDLPKGVLSSDSDGLLTYTLRWVKQAGTEATQIRLTVLPPPGSAVRPMPGWNIREGSATWSGRLLTDLEFVLILEPVAEASP